MCSKIENEWLSVFTPDVQEIWSRNTAELRLINTTYHILQRELKKFEAKMTNRMDGFQQQIKLLKAANGVEDVSDEEVLSTENDVLVGTASLISSPKLQRSRKRHKNLTTSPSLLTVANSDSDTSSYIKPLQENSFNFLWKGKKTDAPTGQDVVNSSIVLSDDTSDDTISTKKSKFIKRSDLLKKKKPSSITLNRLYSSATSKQAKNKEKDALPKRNLFKDYDLVPMAKSDSTEYPYKTEAVRKKADRMQLPGWSCEECEAYFTSLDLSPEKLREKMDRCSKHRNRFDPFDDTPKGFWDITIYSTQDD